MIRKRVQSGAKDAAPDLTPEPRRQPRYERSVKMDTSAELAAAMAEIEKLRSSADAWWSEYDRELKAHEATKAGIEALVPRLAGRCTEALAHPWGARCGRASGHDGECAPGDHPDRPEVTP